MPAQPTYKELFNMLKRLTDKYIPGNDAWECLAPPDVWDLNRSQEDRMATYTLWVEARKLVRGVAPKDGE